MLVIKQLMVPIDFQSIYFNTMEVNGDQQLFGSSKFKITYFVFYITKKRIQVWNDMVVSKWRQKYKKVLRVNYSFKEFQVKHLTQIWYYNSIKPPAIE